MSKDNGGPAFPTTTQVTQNQATGETTVHQYLSDGMTLRDYFAAKAMQGLIAQSCGTAASSSVSFGAEYAYQMADAMMKARES
jgi:hypothetical protein